MQLTKGRVGWWWGPGDGFIATLKKPLANLSLVSLHAAGHLGQLADKSLFFLITTKDIWEKYSPSWTLATSTALHVMAKNTISSQ